MAIDNEDDLGRAINGNCDSIEIEGDLVKKVLKIKATGKVAWAVAIGGIGIAVAVFVSTGGTGAPASWIIGGGAVAVLGLPTAISAVSIALAAGGVGSLNKLRRYKVVEKSDSRVVLKRS